MTKYTVDPSEMNEVSIWGHSLSSEWLSEAEVNYLRQLPADLPTVAWVCGELDRVWHEQRLDNRISLLNQPIGGYYGHPVWLMNGIFSICDPVSLSHRTAIAKHLKDSGVKMIADYGGGFGQLAISIAEIMPDAEIYIVEPYPSKVGIERLRRESRIKIMPNLAVERYEAIVAQDVLEHVEDPVRLASELGSAVSIGGKVIFANCFYPLIQSHLPSTFHLRCTFPYVMKSLGLRYVGKVEGAAHALVFERIGQLSLSNARRAETISRLVGPVLNLVRGILSGLKHSLNNTVR
jgi:hypothetical protein